MDPLVQEAMNILGREVARATKRTELRGILKLCRLHGQSIHYVDIAKALGMFSGGTELATILGELMKEAHDAGEPPLSALVVRTDTGMPGDGFFTYARQLGYEFTDERAFWEMQVTLLGLQLGVGAPSAQSSTDGDPNVDLGDLSAFRGPQGATVKVGVVTKPVQLDAGGGTFRSPQGATVKVGVVTKPVQLDASGGAFRSPQGATVKAVTKPVQLNAGGGVRRRTP